MKKHKKLNDPFDVTYTISFSGRTVSDGVPTTTTQMIRDKIVGELERYIANGWIRDYQISAQRNNIEVSRDTLKKARRK